MSTKAQETLLRITKQHEGVDGEVQVRVNRMNHVSRSQSARAFTMTLSYEANKN